MAEEADGEGTGDAAARGREEAAVGMKEAGGTITSANKAEAKGQFSSRATDMRWKETSLQGSGSSSNANPTTGGNAPSGAAPSAD